MSDAEYNSALQFMEKNLVTGQGLVGIFWYDPVKNVLFGVHKESPFVGDYKDVPRGRIFYSPSTKKFTVCVGNWIKEYTDAIDLIVDEFKLDNENYEVTIQEHWQIGMGYGD